MLPTDKTTKLRTPTSKQRQNSWTLDVGCRLSENALCGQAQTMTSLSEHSHVCLAMKQKDAQKNQGCSRTIPRERWGKKAKSNGLCSQVERQTHSSRIVLSLGGVQVHFACKFRTFILCNRHRLRTVLGGNAKHTSILIHDQNLAAVLGSHKAYSK